jgi:hypothetical protein
MLPFLISIYRSAKELADDPLVFSMRKGLLLLMLSSIKTSSLVLLDMELGA